MANKKEGDFIDHLVSVIEYLRAKVNDPDFALNPPMIHSDPSTAHVLMAIESIWPSSLGVDEEVCANDR